MLVVLVLGPFAPCCQLCAPPGRASPRRTAHQFFDRVIPREIAKDMQVVFDAVDQNRVTVKVLENFSHQGIHVFPMPRVL